MEEELSKLIEGLGELGMAKRSGSHWGGGVQPRRQPARSHPLAGITLGILEDADEQARLASEQALLCSPAANLPQLRPSDGTFASLCYRHPQSNGAMARHGNYYALGGLIEPLEWRNRIVLLEWQAFAGQLVMVCVPCDGQLTQKAKRNMSEQRRIIANDHHGVYLDAPFTKVAGVPELAVSFAFPRVRK